MDNYYYHTENDYTIQLANGCFLTLKEKNISSTNDPNLSISLFMEDANNLVKNLQNEEFFKGCRTIKRDAIINKPTK